MTVTWHFVIVGLIVLQRLAELAYSRRNTARLLASGAILVKEPGYIGIVAVHAAWVLALALAIPADAPVNPYFLALYLAILGLRLWVMASLGRFWSTRIVTLPGAPLIESGPYRFVRHPNYLVVAAEIAVAPLIFGAWGIALVFSALNAAVLAMRIRKEEMALADRRTATGRLRKETSSPAT